MSVGQICVRQLDTVGPEESASIAAERMHQRAVGTLVVVDVTNKPVGIVTDRDLVSRVLAQQRDPQETTIGEVMTPEPITIPAGASVVSALALMRCGRFRRLPVVDEDQTLVGLVSVDDVLMLLAGELMNVSRLLEQQTPRCAVESTWSVSRSVSQVASSHTPPPVLL